MTVTGRQHDHWRWLLLGLAIPVLALLLEVVDGDRISPRFWPECRLPHVCSLRNTFGIGCPGCGLTRSIIHLMHGRVAESLAVHRLGWLVLALALGQVPYRAWRLCRAGREPAGLAWEAPVLIGLAGLLLANRLYDLFG